MSRPPPCPPLLWASGLSPLQRRLLERLARGEMTIPRGICGEFRRLALRALERRGGITVTLDWDTGHALAGLTEHGHQVLREIRSNERCPLTPSLSANAVRSPSKDSK